MIMASKLLHLHFHKAGLQTTIQDFGRPGHQEAGIPIGGALDLVAAKNANLLVGNPLDCPVLEITLLGPKIEFNESCQIAICGANLNPSINAQAISNYQTHTIEKGSTLTFGRPESGCRAYLAIGGEWQIDQWLDSVSPLLIGNNNPLPKSVITKNQKLQIKLQDFVPITTLNVQSFHSPFVIRVLPGPEFEYFSRTFIARFFSQVHGIHPDSNRMGYRLNTQSINFKAPKELISSAVLPGTLQITNNGQAIILMADAQTTGGYCRFVNICQADLGLLAQVKPGDEIRFKLI